MCGVIIVIIEFLTSQLWLDNVHLSWDVVINRIRLGGLTCSLKSFSQLKMCEELQIFTLVYMYWDRLCGLVVRVSGYRYRGPGFDPRRYQIF